MKQVFLILAIASICFSGGLFSKNPPNPIKKTYTFEIDHRNNEVKIIQGSDTVVTKPWDLEMENHWEISKNSKIKIVISNQNPFYFDYKYGGIKKEELESIKDLDEFLKELDKVYEGFKELKPAETNNFLISVDPEAAKFFQTRYKASEDDITVVITRIKDNLGKAKDYALHIPQKIKNTLNATPQDINALRKEVNDTTIIDIDKIHKDIKADYEKIDNYQLQFIKEIEKKQEHLLDYLQHQLLITSILKNQENKIKKLAKILVSFKENCNKLVGKIPLYELTYDKKNKQTISVNISYVDKKRYDTDASGVNFLNGPPKVGDIKLIFTPRSPFEFKFSINGIYTTIKEKVEEGEDEKSRIIDMPALTIITKILKSEDFRLAFQIGATLKSETINTIFGAGFVISKRFFIGGGLHLQFPKGEDAKTGGYFSIGLLIK